MMSFVRRITPLTTAQIEKLFRGMAGAVLTEVHSFPELELTLVYKGKRVKVVIDYLTGNFDAYEIRTPKKKKKKEDNA